MEGIALVLDLVRKNPNFPVRSVHSYGWLSAKLAASTAAASFAAGGLFPSRSLFGISPRSVVYFDVGPPVTEDYISSLQTASGKIFQSERLGYTTKEYNIELKPLLSAFHWKTFTLTTLRSFLLYYLPLVGPQLETDEDDDEGFPLEASEEQRIDYVVPFKKSVKQIVRETTVVTTRRVLERMAIHYFSQRIAWKLLKDVPKSAVRKAGRGLPTHVYFISVARTTLRGHCLGVAASWIVQVGIEIYRFFRGIFKPNEEVETVNTAKQVQILGKKVYGVTVRCSASLVFASIGAGIGATIFRPSSGQSIGCLIGDLAGPIIVTYCFEKVHLDL